MVEDLQGYTEALERAEAEIREAMSYDDVDALSGAASSALVAALEAIEAARAAETVS